MGAFIKFNKSLLQLPVPIQVWVMILAAMNMIGPLFFLEHLEAKIVLGVFMLSAMLMMFLTAMTGFTRLLGLGHVLWFPLLFFLWGQLEGIPSTDWFGLWLRGLTMVNAISLVFDVIDVSRYVAGERDELVPQLS